MVIAPARGGVGPFVILSDGEHLPEKFNTLKVVVMRRGESTNRELKVLKEFGVLAAPELIKLPEPPVCNYSGDGNPLHQHVDETWWYYEETWTFEEGPFKTYEEGYAALEAYCVALNTEREKDTEPIVEEEEPEKQDIEVQDAETPS